ncbi:MAG: ketoacyl-ACP synthase III [Chlorobiales bacterium]|nr:ketoacyl-ACP synthase III [Chlorobiales bacterium]
MTGIEDIAVYVPEQRASNRELMTQFEMDESFLVEKIGVLQRAVKSAEEDTSDMALKALEKLLAQTGLAREEIQALVVVTQNPDSNLPHVSALVHGRAKLSPDCAAFDISLGCSGFVYGLSVLQSFLAANGLSKGVLITCDPYSKVIDPADKNTVLLFGDAATATLIGPKPVLMCRHFLFGTQGDLTGALVCRAGTLQMNGREVFNFAATVVPKHIEKLLAKASLNKDEVDCYIFHQGSRYIVETLSKRLGLDRTKVRLDIENIGNTVSSSIPILLQRELADQKIKTVVLCGFGVGLSWASCICNKTGV